MADNIISNMSYTNKDFQTIYPELLDLVKKLTDKWDPSLSNESDPGVILLKLNAIIADKNNYNIDKSILEAFPQSVTQVGNARKLYDICGYKMGWYKSASGEVTVFNQTGRDITEPIIPRFTSVTDGKGTVLYTTLSPVSSIAKSGSVTVPVMEGTHKVYSVSGLTTVTLANLDSELRLYFPETTVAENGIFVSNISNGTVVGNYDDWTVVDNLAAYPLNNTVYEFGLLPNSDTCYIQFPQDIANLIQEGIQIDYLVSSGAAGAVKAATLTSFVGDIKLRGDEDITSKIIVSNTTSINNGSDPETISEAYKNYKRTVGTSNTLITCEDYANYAHDLVADGRNVISNGVVSDRTNDFNTVQVVTQHNKSFSTKLYSAGDMSAFELKLYLLTPQQNVTTADQYANTFRPDPALAVQVKGILNNSDISFAQHDYKNIGLTDPYLYVNKFPINCQIVTQSKVTTAEGAEIIQNIWQTLYKKYNSRMLTYGEAIDYDELVETIQSADSRIKIPIVEIPSYTTYLVKANNNSVQVSGTAVDDNNKDLYAKMVLAGKAQLIEFETDFNYDFGQNIVQRISDVETISTETTISTSHDSSTYDVDLTDLTDNEYIQIVQPSYTAEKIFSQYVTITNAGTTAVNFVAGQVVTGIQINIDYRAADGSVIHESYGTDKIFRSNFTREIPVGGPSILLSGQDQLELLSTAATTVSLEDKYGYWITNTRKSDGNYILFNINQTSRFLDVDEYFMYTNASKTGIAILGSGTLITRTVPAGTTAPELSCRPVSSIDHITSDGVSAISEALHYFSDDSYTVSQMDIVTLDNTYKTLSLTNTSAVSSLTNSYILVEGASFKDADDQVTSLSTCWVRSRLTLKTNSITPQKLETRHKLVFNNSETDTLRYSEDDECWYYRDAEIATSTDDMYVYSNAYVDISGGESIDVRATDEQGKTNPIKVNLSTSQSDVQRSDGWVETSATKSYTVPVEADRDYIIPVDIIQGSLTATVKDGSTDVPISLYNVPEEEEVTSLSLSTTRCYYITFTAPTSSTAVTLTLTVSPSGSTTAYVGRIYEIKTDPTPSDTVLEQIRTLLTSGDEFDYTYIVPEVECIDNPIDANMFWDPQHIANRYVLPMIDTSNSTVKIASISKV